MSQKQGWVTLDSCIYDYISDAELNQNSYFRLFHQAFRFMDDCGLDFFYQVKSIKVPVNANKTVTLPDDYLNYTKLGVLNNSGGLISLKQNSNLTTFADLNPDRVAQTDSSNFINIYSFSSPVFYNFWNGDSYNNLYGVSDAGVYGGGFNIDINNGVIILDSSFSWNGLVLEYIATPKEGEEYRLPMVFREALIAWLSWKQVANSMKRGVGNLIGIRRHEYFEARRKAIQKWKPFYLDQAVMVNAEAQKLVAKT